MSALPLLQAHGVVPVELPQAAPLDVSFDAGLVVLVGAEQVPLSAWLHALAGFTPPLAGRLQLLGQPALGDDAPHWQELRRQVGFVTPQAPLLSIMSGLRNTMLPALYHRLGNEVAVEQRARALLAELDYAADHTLLPAYMSELQRHHLLIVRALMAEPRILLLEQPLAWLDPRAADLLRDYIVSKVCPRVPLLLVTANDPLLAEQADAVLFVGTRRVLQFTDWAALRSSGDDEVQQFLQLERRVCAVVN